MTGEETARYGMERKEFLRKGGHHNGKNDPVHKYGVKRRSCLYGLPYWKVSYVHIFLIL